MIVGCSGGSDPLSPAEIPPGHHTILDLALSRDFDPAIADLPQVELITLESVRLAAPEETEEAVATAERIVESETQAFAARQKTRNIDSAIVALRSHTMEVLDEELDKVRSQFGCTAATNAPHGEVPFAHPHDTCETARNPGANLRLHCGTRNALRNHHRRPLSAG